ncbi:MAG: protease family protein [Pyrinomonadaceae bacterium]|jgi:membrane protease YdiL (CAAX protease family)|nr:protease family protein [Pyrinomonadaceae bacterium]
MDAQQIFINSVGRLRSGWRVLIFIVVYVALLFLLSTVVRVGYAVGLQLAPGRNLGGFTEDFIFRLILFASALLAGYVCNRWLEGLPWRAFGLTRHAGWWRDFIVGSLIGVVSLALATAIAAAAGGLRFIASPRTMLWQVVQTLFMSALLFVFAALAEEALFRGYPLQTLTRAKLAWLAIFLTSVPFAAVHLNNPNVVKGFTFINTALAGVWLAVAYLRTRSLWLPLGVHWAWNWALGSLFGLPVSGITTIAPNPLLHGTDLGPAWLTGGSYGIEGGLACTIALIVSTMFIWKMQLVSATREMEELTSKENPVVTKSSVSITP